MLPIDLANLSTLTCPKPAPYKGFEDFLASFSGTIALLAQNPPPPYPEHGPLTLPHSDWASRILTSPITEANPEWLAVCTPPEPTGNHTGSTQLGGGMRPCENIEEVW
jgi:hypothetical protein